MGTKVSIHTDLKISGKVAQFGKNMIAEVSGKLIGQFVDCIEQRLLGDAVIDAAADDGAKASTSDTSDSTATQAPRPATAPVEPLDLMDLAGNSIYKRLAPVGAVIALLILAKFLFGRRS